MPGVLASLIDRFGFELAAVGAGVLGLLCATVMVLVARNARLRAAATEERELTRFWLLADATFSGVFVYRDNVILDVNAALCRFMGCAAADLVGHEVSEFVAPHSRERLFHRIQSGEVENEEFDVIVKSGALRTVVREQRLRRDRRVCGHDQQRHRPMQGDRRRAVTMRVVLPAHAVLRVERPQDRPPTRPNSTGQRA